MWVEGKWEKWSLPPTKKSPRLCRTGQSHRRREECWWDSERGIDPVFGGAKESVVLTWLQAPAVCCCFPVLKIPESWRRSLQMCMPAIALKCFHNHPFKVLLLVPYGKGTRYSQKFAEILKQGAFEKNTFQHFCVLLSTNHNIWFLPHLLSNESGFSNHQFLLMESVTDGFLYLYIFGGGQNLFFIPHQALD